MLDSDLYEVVTDKWPTQTPRGTTKTVAEWGGAENVNRLVAEHCLKLVGAAGPPAPHRGSMPWEHARR